MRCCLLLLVDNTVYKSCDSNGTGQSTNTHPSLDHPSAHKDEETAQRTRIFGPLNILSLLLLFPHSPVTKQCCCISKILFLFHYSLTLTSPRPSPLTSLLLLEERIPEHVSVLHTLTIAPTLQIKEPFQQNQALDIQRQNQHVPIPVQHFPFPALRAPPHEL